MPKGIIARTRKDGDGMVWCGNPKQLLLVNRHHWWVLHVEWWIGRLNRLERVGGFEAVRICWKQ